jgi:hypothetical protein
MRNDMAKKSTLGQSIGMGILFAVGLVLMCLLVAITLGGSAAASLLYLVVAGFVLYLIYQFIRSAVASGVRDGKDRK